MILTSRHPDLEQQEKTYVASPIAAATTEITVKSAAGFAADQLIVIGNLGSEKTEIKYISAVNTGTNVITLKTTAGWSGCVFSHAVDAPVTVIPYDQVEFHQASIKGGTYTLRATVNLDSDQEFTRYDFLTGVSTDYFKVRYKNSGTGNVSEFSGEFAAAGYTPQALATLIREVRIMVGKKPTDEELTDLFNLAEETIYDLNDKWWFAKKKYVHTTVDSTARFDIPTDLKTVDVLIYKDGVTTMTELNYSDYKKFMLNLGTTTTESDTHADYTFDEDSEEIILSPIPLAGGKTIELWYWKKPSVMSQYTDETTVPSTRAMVFWVASKIEAAKKNTDQSKAYWSEYTQAINNIGNSRISKTKSFFVRK